MHSKYSYERKILGVTYRGSYIEHRVIILKLIEGACLPSCEENFLRR